MINMASKVWFITGTSKGFGRVWAEAALARGDRVAATARRVDTLAPLVERYGNQVAAIALDVTDKAAVGAAIHQAHANLTRAEYARRLETWEKWNDVALEAQGDLQAKRSL